MKDIVKNLPSAPGIYKMKNKEGNVIYIGKAKDLRKRVQTYFRQDYQHSTRTRKLIQATEDIEIIRTDTELEALLLEHNLIHELRPRYNILMKDDKTYVYIKVNLDEDFPRIRIVRERTLQKTAQENEKARYFGPKLATSKVYETLRILKKLFPFRHCQLDIKSAGENKTGVEVKNKVIDYPCLDYFIKRCPGPCLGAISPDAYKKIVQQILSFLEGKTDDLEKSLKTEISLLASQKLFEKAARLRDKLFALQSITERQKITDLEREDTDVINYTADLGHVYFNIFMIRGGKLINQENFILDALEINQTEAKNDEKEMLESFLFQYYEKAADIPKEILVPESLENTEIIEKWLAEKRGGKVKIRSPLKGEKNKLLSLSLKNAVSFSKQYKIKWLAQQQGSVALERLKETLNMKENTLKRIEAFDISHLGGTDIVGSMVVFENGAPKQEHYRHFKIRTVSNKPDDYRCMEEILMRRFKYLSKEKPLKERKIKMPSKKDFEELKTFCKDKSLNQKDFLVAKEGKKIIGFGGLKKLNEKITVISNLKDIDYLILKKLIAKSKLKKIYVCAEKELLDYYAVFGFIQMREPPEILVKYAKHDSICMVYETIKHKTDSSFASKPDLIIIDGGKGQLSTAKLVLKRLKLGIPAIALAKRFEEIYIPSEKAPILLEEGDEALKLLKRLRDESHRFAITFQRELHRKNLITPP